MISAITRHGDRSALTPLLRKLSSLHNHLHLDELCEGLDQLDRDWIVSAESQTYRPAIIHKLVRGGPLLRRLLLESLTKRKWVPKGDNEAAVLAAATGDWTRAISLGEVSIEPLGSMVRLCSLRPGGRKYGRSAVDLLETFKVDARAIEALGLGALKALESIGGERAVEQILLGVVITCDPITHQVPGACIEALRGYRNGSVLSRVLVSKLAGGNILAGRLPAEMGAPSAVPPLLHHAADGNKWAVLQLVEVLEQSRTAVSTSDLNAVLSLKDYKDNVVVSEDDPDFWNNTFLLPRQGGAPSRVPKTESVRVPVPQKLHQLAATELESRGFAWPAYLSRP